MFPYKNRNTDERVVRVNKDLPVVIDGVEAYETLCPVNELTGTRANPLELLMALSNDPVRSRKLTALLSELPTIASDSRLSDDQKIGMLCDKLQTGVPADDDQYRRVLEKLAAPLFKSFGDKSDSDKLIQFDKSDSAAADSAAAPAAE